MRGPGFASFLACSIAAPLVLAAPPSDLGAVSSPKEAYDRGTRAWKSGDKEGAAHWFARADALAPSDRALGAALRAATAVDLPALAMALAVRSERSDSGKELGRLAEAARAKHGKSVGRASVECTGTAVCPPKLDAEALPEAGFVGLGDHVVSWTCPDGEQSERISVGAGAEVRVEARCAEAAPPEEPAAPVPPPRVAPPSEHAKPAPPPADRGEPPAGVSPTWFWVGAGVTVALGAVTVWSGLDTRAKHDDYVSDGRRDSGLRDDGMAAEKRTNLLAIGTGVAALGTAALGLFVVDFGGQTEIGLTPTGARFGARF